MFGNILNNSQIERLMGEDHIIIKPFSEKRLRLAHYALRPIGIIEPQKLKSSGVYAQPAVRNFDENQEYVFEADEYAIVEVEEFIFLKKGIVGHFIPSSTLIDRGFSLTAGKLDPGYGQLSGQRQKVRFGVKNQLGQSNTLSRTSPIAHIYFVDMRGLNNKQSGFPEEEEKSHVRERSSRFIRASDDGVYYDDEQ